jgi:sulfur-oxidizing protein SoxY
MIGGHMTQGFGVLEEIGTVDLTRRAFLTAGGAGLASATFVSPLNARDETMELLKRLTGKIPAESDRIHLVMPRVFPNGYTVPLAIEIDSPMTETDHVKHVRVLAPQNPLIEVATFYFTPQRSEPRVSARIRLAKPQYVLAVAEMNDGMLLMTKAWVEVATNGCA